MLVVANVSQVPLLYDVHRAARLTGLAPARLRQWARSGLFAPSHDAGVGEPIYSFDDVVGLRVLAILSIEHEISTARLRKVGVRLREISDSPWSRLKLCVAGKEILFVDSKTNRPISAVHFGQAVFEPLLDLKRVEAAVRADALKMKERRTESIGKVARDRGAAVIEGTRLRPSAIAAMVSRGLSKRWILDQYPSLREDDIRVSVAYANERKHRRRSA
ncbi:MAG: DUF433 domain-containing protein [Deltaproteobacteria bacterium]|nr:DUF433 domain-containing protein [Deltaproteobacteria bacterium]